MPGRLTIGPRRTCFVDSRDTSTAVPGSGHPPVRVRHTRRRIRHGTDEFPHRWSNARDAVTALTTAVVGPDALDALVAALEARGFRVVGPTVRDGAIVYDDLELRGRSPDRLDGRAGRRHVPARAPRRRGPVRLRRRAALVEAVPVPGPRQALAGEARRTAASRSRSQTHDDASSRAHRRALVRAARDRDPGPRLPRRDVHGPRLRRPPPRRCSSSRSTASSRAAPASASRWGPARRPRAGYDLALTEILDGEHRFLVEIGIRARRRGPGRAPVTSRDATPTSSAAGRAVAGRRGAHGPDARHRPTCASLLAAQPRAPALGRGRRRAA